MTTFADLGVPEDLVAVLAAGGIDQPFPVQVATIPDLLAGRDVQGRAPTGSGKTLAFGIPIAARIGTGEPKRPRCLVLAPTRELAQQIRDSIGPLVRVRDRRVLAVYGGARMDRQIDALRKGVDVLVACPGRLQDLIDRGVVALDHVDIVVIDEADRMADMGFIPQVRALLDATAAERQTVLFSATLDGDVRELADRYQTDPTRHEVGDTEPDMTAMVHEFRLLRPNARSETTAAIINEAGATIVFCRTRHGVDRVTRQLAKHGVEAVAIHGGRSQAQRSRALRSFVVGESAALVATDVAARGIHVDGVAAVIHFDPPDDAKTYIHRSGRTARAGATGRVVTLLRGEQGAEVRSMLEPIGVAVEPVEVEPASRKPAPGPRQEPEAGPKPGSTTTPAKGKRKLAKEKVGGAAKAGPRPKKRGGPKKRSSTGGPRQRMTGSDFSGQRARSGRGRR